MSLETGAAAPTTAELLERFSPYFADIAAGAVERDRSRSLPHREITALIGAGFGALRVPVTYGGFGASMPQLFEMLTALAAADSNIAQALRGHFAFVEDRLAAAPGPHRDQWLRRFAAGEVVGNSWTEVGPVDVGTVGTKVSPDGAGGFRLNGTKYYSTGSIFADWIDTLAERTDTGKTVIAVVRADQPGVSVDDDWDGFGQRTTGTGTSTFVNAAVAEAEITDYEARFPFQTAFYQAVLLAVMAGSVLGAQQEFAAALAARTRTFSHGSASTAAGDPQLLQVIGEVTAAAFAARAIVRQVAVALQAAHESAVGIHSGSVTAAEDIAANDAAELASAQGQVALTGLATTAIAHAFDALAASATSESKALDRHWRNARTAGNHNPWVYKARIVGDWAVNGRVPERDWAVGAAKR
ncbi:acyl-CoA dehydrogenase family protein [Arthrobacter citreus]|uniref:acyl-CoA dehydrogenase family protein n=1 Tax=Arthrobacter TaxID=1663 RepID=UPI00126569DC|nr:acyl-CoA dehydrogenase family protein [Arthrobacter gandavensis]